MDRARLTAATLAIVLLAGCAERADPPAGPGGGGADAPAGEAGSFEGMAEGTYTATVETSLGNFTVELWEDKAPLHVANFLQYAQSGHYDGTLFHRVASGFVIQGGGFAAPFGPSSQPKPTLAPIPTEIWPGTSHEVGTLGMARTQDPDSATSQWFVNTNRNTNLDDGYTVFGNVTSGMDVVRAIEQVPVETRGSFQNVPREDVVIRRVTVSTPPDPARPAVVAMQGQYGLAPGRTLSVPVVVENAGGTRATFEVEASGEGLTATVPRQPGALSPGYRAVAIVEVRAAEDWQGGSVTVTARGGEGEDAVTLGLRTLEVGAAVAGNEHPKVSAHYVGLYDNGVVFDTTSTTLDDRGFAMASRWSEHPDPLKVWVGEGQPSDADYTPVIDGFRSGIVGLAEGETRAVRLSPEEGYRDGKWRIFEMNVASID